MGVENLIKHFYDVLHKDPCIFIIRHAEKYIIDDIRKDIQQTITPTGRIVSKKLGLILRSIYPKIGIVRSSPIIRCVETANEIFSVYKQKIPITLDTVLGEDGAYVSDGNLAMKTFLNYQSLINVFVDVQAGKILPGMRCNREGSKLLLTTILQDLENLQESGFYITHDGILAVFLGTLINQLVNEKNWIQYLDGIGIKRSKNKIHLYWGKSMFDVTEKIDNLMEKY